MLQSLPENIPDLPGVYIMKTRTGKVLYVGKAKSLRSRLRYYFQEGIDPRKARLMKDVEEISFIITENELEALALEANLIKQYKPRYNVILRDDKNYPYIKIVLNERFPHIEVARRIKQDGSLYFGPYIPAGVMWTALSFIRRNFNIRPCRYKLDKPMKPCIQYQMKRCPAPCAGLISEEEYRKALSEVILFLRGQKKELLEELEQRMYELSDRMLYEEAARVRDRIFSLRRLWESQRVVTSIMDEMDVIGFRYSEGNSEGGSIRYAFVILFLRNGLITGKKEFFFSSSEIDPSVVLQEFIEVFYSKEIIPPEIILLPQDPLEKEMLEKWLSQKRHGGVTLRIPLSDEEKGLLAMAEENARVFFEERSIKAERLMREIKDLLDLPSIPESIGAFDISTTSGKESTGGFIWYQGGEFLKERYRHVKVLYEEVIVDRDSHGTSGGEVTVRTAPNDYAMLEELIKRVIDNLGGEMPDLLIVDGGPGQLEILRRTVESKKEIINTPPMLVAIAKDPDRAFLVDGRIINLEGLSGPDEDAALLLRRIRDEAHRFAIMYHRKLRQKRLRQSLLEEIPGIGKKRRLELLRLYGSLDAIRKADPQEIAKKIPGIGIKRATLIIEHLRKAGNDGIS